MINSPIDFTTIPGMILVSTSEIMNTITGSWIPKKWSIIKKYGTQIYHVDLKNASPMGTNIKLQRQQWHNVLSCVEYDAGATVKGYKELIF